MGLSHAAFARIVGVSQQAVSKAVKAGRLVASVLPNGTIDPALGPQEWKRISPADDRPTGLPGSEDGASIGKSASIAKALKMSYEAKLVELEYKRKSGELVPRAEVEAALDAMARRLRDYLLSVAGRVSPLVFGAPSLEDVHRLIEREMNQACDEISGSSPDEDARAS